MDCLLLGLDGSSKRLLRQQISSKTGTKVRFFSHSLDADRIPKTGQWHVIFLDCKAKSSPEVASAVKKDQLKGLKIVLTEKEDLRRSIDFWGTSVYSYLLKPLDRELFRVVWKNVRERIELARKLSRLDVQIAKDRNAVLEHQENLKDMFVANLEMQELTQKKTNFLARTAHELGTPLTALQGYLELLSKGKPGAVNEFQAELLKRSLDSCRRLSRLTGTLMDLSALDGAKGHLQLEEGNIQECIVRAASELSQATEAKRIDLRICPGSGVPIFRFDKDRMHQVFVNLLENAVKFTPDNGSIQVRCTPHFWERRTVREMVYAPQERRARVAPTACNSVRIIVEDTGIGIASDMLLDVFEEYSREMNGNGSYKGFGLGLAVTRQIVLAHQGKVWAENNRNQGSSFTILIPTSL